MQISEQGAAMRRARQRAGLSLRKLSARAGVTRQAISLLERGRREGNLSTVIPLADALGLSLDEYLGRTAPEHKMPETEALEICKIALRVFAAECLAETEALPARTREGYAELVKLMAARYDIEVMLDALKKRRPMRPREVRGSGYMSVGLCPVCGEGCNSEFDCCCICGQRLSWLEEENDGDKTDL